jgi:hypothetical protein
MPEVIECRGRNGWFKYKDHSIWLHDNVATVPILNVNLYSKYPASVAPIIVLGRADDVLALFEDIVAAMKLKMEKPKPRMAIVLEGGLVTEVFCDAKIELDVLVIDKDDDSEEWAVYSSKKIQVEPPVVDNLFHNARNVIRSLHATEGSPEVPRPE